MSDKPPKKVIKEKKQKKDKPEKWTCPDCKQVVAAKNELALKSGKYYHKKVKCPNSKNKQAEIKKADDTSKESELEKKINDIYMITLGLYASIFNSNLKGIRNHLMKDYSLFYKLRDEFIEQNKDKLRAIAEQKEKTLEQKREEYERHKQRIETFYFERSCLARELGYVDEDGNIIDDLELDDAREMNELRAKYAH